MNIKGVMFRQQDRQSAGGFTLIELIITISILALLMLIVFSSFRQLLRSKSALDDRRDGMIMANAILIRMTRELQLMVEYPTLLTPPGQTPTFPSSLIADEKTMSNGLHGDTIKFVAQGAGQYVAGGASHSGFVDITYRVEEDPEAPMGAEQANYYLVREEIPHIRPVDFAFERALVFPVSKNLVSLELNYYNSKDEKWVNSWSAQGTVKLPDLIKLSITVRSPLGKLNTYATMVAIGNSN